MQQVITSERAEIIAEIEDLFDSLSTAKKQLALRLMLKRALSVTSGTAEPVAAERPTLRILKTPATGRPHTQGGYDGKK